MNRTNWTDGLYELKNLAAHYHEAAINAQAAGQLRLADEMRGQAERYEHHREQLLLKREPVIVARRLGNNY